MTEMSVGLGGRPPETVLDPPPRELVAAIETAGAAPDPRAALAEVVAAHPESQLAWAELGDRARDPVEAYAYYRVGYHRGLDALRAAGWRGSGYVRGRHAGNVGFLRSLDGLRRSAGAIGEHREEERCDLFLRQLDPEWVRGATDAGGGGADPG